MNVWPTLREHLLPPSGVQVRRLVALVSLAIALPRILTPLNAPCLNWLEPQKWGYLFLALAFALAATTRHLNYNIIARLVAAVGATLYAIAAADASAESATLMLTCVFLAYALLGEAARVDEC